MDPPFSEGEQPPRYTSGLVPGAAQQSSCVSELASMDTASYYTPSPVAQIQSPHPSEAASLPSTSASYEIHYCPSCPSPTVIIDGYTTCFPSMTSNPQHFPRSHHHHAWSSPPPGSDEFDEYSYHASPTCASSDTCYNPSPVSPTSWPSPQCPHHTLQQPLDQFPSQDSFKNLQICTPTSTDSFPLPTRGPQLAASYTGSFIDRCLDADIDGLPRDNTSGRIQDFLSASLPATPSPGEFPAGTPIYMPAINQDDASLGGPQNLASPDGNPIFMPATNPNDASLGSPQNLASPDGNTETREPNIEDTPIRDDEPYAQLIYRAFKSRDDHTMTLQEIYSWFRDNTKKGNSQSKGWQNSIRHNLSMNAAFTKRDDKTLQTVILVGNRASLPTDSKRSTEWVLADWAIKDGVQSTTRYRKGNPTRSRASSQSGSQQTDGQISTRAISGRRGGNAASRARLRSRQNAQQTSMPLTPATVQQLPLPIGPPLRPAMPSSMYPYGGDEMLQTPLQTPPQMAITQNPTYSPLTPETNAPDSFSLVLPEASQAHHGVSANPAAAYALASGNQGSLYNAPSPSEFPFSFNDISGMYPGEYSQNNSQHIVGGASGSLFPMNGDAASYGWGNDAP
ncbi:hypothetical protein BGZ61DRAFT_527974 [Ilyonectria robusta]|uniref:uncharacterized protein n=1 Tax=Ilyonectria robusta TaxID=1079257 RepID=UPI001E8DB9D5|nr:uncharacterized protein BGZ61DRAFT_527974 [Ilyonectria robusta]KAH8734657.1 hypothetical protein BGZ61DRAFT_527974 [Ilyonectria robusta]